MFKYTRASIDAIIDDVKKYCNTFKYVSLLVTIGLFTYASIMKYGYFWVNIGLLIFFVLYGLFELVTFNKNFRAAKKLVRRTYRWTKIAINTISLAGVVYGVYMANNSSSAITIILTTLMIILWVLQVLFEIVLEICENRKDLVIDAWNEDINVMKDGVQNVKDTVMKPINSVNNFIKKVRGEEIEEPEEPKERKKNKNIRRLDEIIEQKRIRKEKAKAKTK